MTALAVLEAWFAAWERGDRGAARELLAEDAVVHVDPPVTGFDGFVDWYERRRKREGPEFSWRVDDVLAGESHAAAVIAMTAGGEEWRQLALYRIAGDVIAEIWAYEDR